MGWLDFLLLALVAAWLTVTLLWLYRRRKRGEACTGCCATCKRRCASTPPHTESR